MAAGNTGCTISRQPAQVDRAANRTGTAKARWSFRHGPFWQPYQPGPACCCVHFHGTWQLGLPALIPRPPRRVMPAKLAGGQVDSQQQQPKRGSHRPAQAHHPSTCLWRRLSTNLPLRQTAHRTGRCTLCTPQCTSGKPAKQERLVDRRATWRPLHRSTCYPRRCAPHFRRLRPAQDLPQGLLLRVCGHPLQDRARALRQGPPQPRAPEAVRPAGAAR